MLFMITILTTLCLGLALFTDSVKSMDKDISCSENLELKKLYEEEQNHYAEKFEIYCQYDSTYEGSDIAARNIKQLLQQPRFNPSARTKKNQSLLACLLDSNIKHEQMLEVMSLLIAKGASVNDCNEDGDSILLHASCKCYTKRKHAVEIANELLANGACVNAQLKRDGRTPLHIAIIKSNLELFKTILDKNPEYTKRDALGYDPYCLAAACGELEMLKILDQKKNFQQTTDMVNEK